jgi:acetyl esterase/lipase
MRLNLATRMVGAALKRLPNTSITSMSPEDIKDRRRRGIPKNVVTTAVTGGLAHGVETQERILATTAGYLPVRTYRPSTAAGALPVMVHFHGGGWVLGDLDSGDWLCSHVATGADVLVVSVDYCLAPEHPFPGAVDECLAATRWVAEHADELGGDGDRIAVMGDSAGGNLAAVVAQLAREEGPELRYQVLIYPGTDATLSSPSIVEKADAPLLTRDDIVSFLGHYLGGADATDPRVSPLLVDDHAGLPPALVQTAEHDPLLDDGRRYAEALRHAGVAVRYTQYLGVPHGYINAPGLVRTSAHQALSEIVAELRTHLA